MNKTNELRDILTMLRDFDVGQVKLKVGEIELECTFNHAISNALNASNAKKRFTVPGVPPENNYAHATLSVADQTDLSILGPALGFTPTKTARVVHKSDSMKKDVNG